MTEHTYNIRYIGFANLADAGRRMEYAITARGLPTLQATVEIPGSAFSGPHRVTFQESAGIGYERLRRAVEARTTGGEALAFVLTPEEIEEYRPRRRAASKKA